MTRNIDELNNLTTKAVEPEKYFGEMELSEEQFERRVEYTKKANELFDVILILLLTMRDNGEVNYVYARSLLESWLLSLIAEYTTPDNYLIDYATDTAYNFVDTTKNHIEENWYTSSDRALYNAENSANDVLNYDEYQQAIKDGKTHKKWITEKDNKVRKTHKALEGNTIPIKDFFRVGLARMRFPKDYEYADMFPEELVNCRCKIKYLPSDKNDADGKVIIPDGYDTNKYSDEIDMANWISQKYGGKIELLNRSDESGVKTPDYMWDNKLWELKSVSTVKAPDSALRKGIQQIQANPGGIILNFGKNEVEIGEAMNIIDDRLKRSGKFDFDVMILQNNNVTKYIRNKYKK